MPAPSSAGTQPSSSTPYPALQNDYNLLDSWLKTQATPESVLKSWENIKKNSCTNEAQSTVAVRTVLSYPSIGLG